MGKNKGLFEIIRTTSFTKFFVSWIISIFVFALIYWIAAIFSKSLVFQEIVIQNDFIGIFRSLHASFFIATLFGFQAIDFPVMLMYVAYIQFAYTVIVLLIFLDKIVQKYMHPHYHKMITHEKKINTMMLMMSIFRNDIDHLRHEFKSKSKHNVNIKEIEAIIDGLYVVFLDIEKLFSDKNTQRHMIKDSHYHMLTVNIEDSLEKLANFIDFLEEYKMSWHDDKSVDFWIKYILNTADNIVRHVNTENIKNPRVIIALENIIEYTEKIRKKL